MSFRGSPVAQFKEETFLNGLDVPESVPDCYVKYKKCERWGNWWPGGLADQPHILMMEFLSCLSGEARFSNDYKPMFDRVMEQINEDFNASGNTGSFPR